MNINKVHALLVAMLLYLAKHTAYECLIWAIIDSVDTATHIASFRTPAYPVTGS